MNEPNKSPWREALDPSPLREAATFPPQADHVLVVFFFGRGRPGGCVKAPRHSILKQRQQQQYIKQHMTTRQQVMNSFYNRIPYGQGVRGRLNMLSRDMEDIFKR